MVKIPIGITDSSNNHAKMADGTLICWGIYPINTTIAKSWSNHFYEYISTSISFPVVFKSNPIVMVSHNNTYISNMLATNINTKNINTIYVVSPEKISDEINTNIKWLAVGRWK